MHACCTANKLSWSTSNISSGPNVGRLVNFIWSFHCKFSSYACIVGCESNAEAYLADTLQYDACRLELKLSQGCAWCCPCGVSIDMACLAASQAWSKFSSSCCYSEVTGSAACMSGHCLVACLQMPSLPSHTWQCHRAWRLLLCGTYALTATHEINQEAKLVAIVIAYALCLEGSI